MTGIQFSTQVLLSRAVLRTGLVPRKAETLSWHQYFQQGTPLLLLCSDHAHGPCFTAPVLPAVVPNGLSTGLDIGLSNYSLSLITLSFYTMCKSTTPIFLLGFCFLWGLERCARMPAQGCCWLNVWASLQPAGMAGVDAAMLLAQAQLEPGRRGGRPEHRPAAPGVWGD